MNHKLIAPLFFLFQLVLMALPASAEHQPLDYILKDGKVFKANSQYEELAIEGCILSIYPDNEKVYYIKESRGTWFAGVYDAGSKNKNEYMLGNNYTKLYRLMVLGNAYYFLADIEKQLPDNQLRTEKVLIRFDPESTEQKQMSDIDDFILNGNNLVILNSSGINNNGSIIPLVIKGSTFIDKMIDSRFLFVTNGADIEVIDLLSKRNIYQYRKGTSFLYNAEYNLILEFSDIVKNTEDNNPDDKMIYYQLTLNGFETGRTETGPAAIVKSFTLKAETGRYSIIKAERWELDKDKGRYVRVNNVMQPEEIKIFIPENRIIKIKMEFNGTAFLISQSVCE